MDVEPGGVAVVGTFTADIVIHGLGRIAEPGGVVYLDEPPAIEPGGHAVNVAIDLSRLAAGVPIASIGAVGRDLFAEILESALREWNVKPLLERHDVGTARNAIIVVKGEDRRFHVYRGANSRLSAAHVVESISRLEPRILYISVGFSRSVDDSLETVLEEARRHAELVYLDPAYTEPSSIAPLRKVLSQADVVHLNTAELRILTGIRDPEEALKIVAKKARLAAVVTSERGVMAASRALNTIISQKSFKVNVVDPTGAGDAFSAGFISQFINEGISDAESLARALLTAQAAGAAAVSMPGATRGVSPTTVRALVESQGREILESTEIKSLE